MGDNVTNDLIVTGLHNELCLGAGGIMPSIKALCSIPSSCSALSRAVYARASSLPAVTFIVSPQSEELP